MTAHMEEIRNVTESLKNLLAENEKPQVEELKSHLAAEAAKPLFKQNTDDILDDITSFFEERTQLRVCQFCMFAYPDGRHDPGGTTLYCVKNRNIIARNWDTCKHFHPDSNSVNYLT